MYGNRYYAVQAPMWRNTDSTLSNYDMKLINRVISDTVLCMKVEENVTVADDLNRPPTASKLTSENYYWYLNLTDAEKNRFPDLTKYNYSGIGLSIAVDSEPSEFIGYTDLIANQTSTTDSAPSENITLTDLVINGSIPILKASDNSNLDYFNVSDQYAISENNIFNFNTNIPYYSNTLDKTLSIYSWNINPDVLAKNQPYQSRGLNYINGIVNVADRNAWYANPAYIYHNLIFDRIINDV